MTFLSVAENGSFSKTAEAMFLSPTAVMKQIDALEGHTYFSFGSSEEHYRYRDAVRAAYPAGHYPVFAGYDHMQYQIRDPQGFADMLRSLMKTGALPPLSVLEKEETV